MATKFKTELADDELTFVVNNSQLIANEVSREDKVKVYVIEPGSSVVCDLCNADFTDSPETGGIYGWSTKAICPRCAPEFLKSAEKFGEMNMLKARCPEGKTFANWVREDLR